MKQELRIGVLLNDNSIPAWFYTMLSEIESLKSAKIVAIVMDNSSSAKEPDTTKSKKYFIYNYFRKIDRKRFKRNNDASSLKDINSLLESDGFTGPGTIIKLGEGTRTNDIDTLERYNIDIFVNFGDYSIENDMINTSKYGVWAYYFGNTKTHRGGPYGFWEVFEKTKEMGVTLEMISEKEKITLFKSTHLTDYLSVERSLNAYYWKSLFILPRKINELFNVGEDEFFRRVNKLNEHPDFYSNRFYEIPTNSRMFFELLKFKALRLKNRLKNLLFFNQWALLFKIADTAGLSTNFFEFKEMVPPKDRFWADPHVIKKNDTYFIFIEELIYAQNKGFISVIEMDSNGYYKAPVKVLETDYHLSYPFIIEDNDEIYMIPESKASKNIQLYKCIDFPCKWELETILIDNIEAVDTTIIIKDGTYWLFTNCIKHKSASIHNELFLYSSDTLVSNKWKSHSENPIVSDVKNARMAGKLFMYNMNLYRPSQNCSKHYGYGMKINHVVELNQDNYEEETIDEIYPNWHKKVHATHSLSSDDRLTVIDAQIKRRKYF